LWANYVVGLDAQRQRTAIYGPIWDAIKAGLAALVDRDAWAAFGQDVRMVLTGQKKVSLESFFHWRAGLLFCLAATSMVAVVRLVRRRRRREANAEANGHRRRAVHEPVEFYQRLERLLARQELVRPEDATQREFAAQAAARFAEGTATRDVAAVPRQVAEAFYRVRFGGRPLDSREAQGVEQALESLEHALSNGHGNGAASA
jgi:hypothetical protein